MPISPGMHPEELAAAAAAAFAKAGDPDITVSGRLLTIHPPRATTPSGRPMPAPPPGLLRIEREPQYDIAVRINDSNIDWGLSPFGDFLEIVDKNPPPILAP